MSIRSKKSASWFARLGTVLGRKRRSASSGLNRRGLRFESLETRSLLSATMLPTISGIVYQNLTGSSQTPLANVTINLWSDGGGSNVFEGNSPGSNETLVGTTTSGANGAYAFNNISTAGTYFVQEDPVPGLTIPSAESVQTVVIPSSALQGTTGTTIDSFASTSQYVSASLHGGTTGMSSSGPTTDAIGGNRNLYVKLTTAGGAIDLGADSDWPGLLDFGADAASNGIFQVNWDGNNSNAAVLNPNGLGGVDLTSQGASTGIELNAAADHGSGFIVLKVYSDASDWSWATVPITNTGDGTLNNSDSQFVAFSSSNAGTNGNYFTVGGGAGADFSQVGAIQLSINGVNAIDGEVGPIAAVGPTVFSENFVNTAEADLSVVKSAAPNPVTAGSQLTYTFTTTNLGPSADTGVALSDTLPAGETYVSSSGQGTVTNNSGQISVQLGNMASGASATTNIVTTVSSSAAGSITNTVTVTGNVPDPNLSNNTSTVTTQINVLVVQTSHAGLTIKKTASPSPSVASGGALTYTMVVTNTSLTTAATNVLVSDPMPAGFRFFFEISQYSLTTSASTFTFKLNTLAPNTSDTITFEGVVTAAAGSTLTNVATATDDQGDTATDSVVTTVFSPAGSKYYLLGR